MKVTRLIFFKPSDRLKSCSGWNNWVCAALEGVLEQRDIFLSNQAAV